MTGQPVGGPRGCTLVPHRQKADHVLRDAWYQRTTDITTGVGTVRSRAIGGSETKGKSLAGTGHTDVHVEGTLAGSESSAGQALRDDAWWAADGPPKLGRT